MASYWNDTARLDPEVASLIGISVQKNGLYIFCLVCDIFNPNQIRVEREILSRKMVVHLPIFNEMSMHQIFYFIDAVKNSLNGQWYKLEIINGIIHVNPPPVSPN